jgi:tetratricopeptide (TPR) repeat protein
MKESGDREMEAACYYNAGQCLMKEQAYDEALEFWARAKLLFTRCNMTTEIIKVTWSIGLMQVAKGSVDEGLETLREVEDEFKDLLMARDEIQVCLDIIEVLLDHFGVSNEEAIDRARCVVTRAQAAQLSNECAIALAHLRRDARDGVLDSEMVRHVKDFISISALYPAAMFVPLRKHG